MTNIDTVQQQLEQARDQLSAAGRSLIARAPGLAELHAAVDGAMQVSTAWADLIAVMMHQAPTTLDHNKSGSIRSDLLADLRAMHGCLTTGPLLLAPARDDLHHLLTSHALVDQQRRAPADHTDGERVLHDVGAVLEADPADVTDQQRNAPVLDPDLEADPTTAHAAEAEHR